MNPSSPSTQQDVDGVLLALDRHRRRREQGVPTLSVLVGSGAAAEAAWQAWAASMGRAAITRDVRTLHTDGAADFRGRAVLYIDEFAIESGDESVRRLGEIVERLERRIGSLGTEQEGMFALAVRPEEAAAYLRDEPYSRTRALFAEGMIRLQTVAESAPPVCGGSGTARETEFSQTSALLAREGVRPETAVHFQAAARAWREAVASDAGSEAADRARSAAERFLFDLLDDLPETQGLFELNVRLGFCFGPMPAEVDLLAASLRMAVEIDGFHHFRDAEGYRRDRRKDALLQKQGFLVLRFLAEDVVARLEEIVDEIRAAVAFRRATR